MYNNLKIMQANILSINQSDLSKIKSIELDILKETLSVIKRLNLRYFAVGGTALGSIKYSGFIPWDDDIDLAMPREDYELFKIKAKSLFPQHLFVQSDITDKEFPLEMIKIRDTRTLYIEYSTANFDIQNGIFIDIFPIDGYKSKRFKPPINYKLRSAFISQHFNSLKKPSFKGKFLNRLAHFLYKKKGIEYCRNKNSQFLKRLNFEKTKYSYCRTQIIKSSYFKSNEFSNFEGIKINIPSDITCYLTDCFGDFKKDLPPELKVSHHYCLYYDTNLEGYNK